MAKRTKVILRSKKKSDKEALKESLSITFWLVLSLFLIVLGIKYALTIGGLELKFYFIVSTSLGTMLLLRVGAAMYNDKK